MTITRNSDGFATVNEGERNGWFRRPLPFDYHVYFEDFIAAASAVPAGWTHTQTNGTAALAGGSLGSVLTQTLGGADNDASQLQATTATLAILTGKRAHFRWRGKLYKGSTGTVAQQEMYIGIGAAQTTTSFVAAAGTSLAVDDFIGFAVYDGNAGINCVCRATDVESVEANAAQIVDDTMMELAWDLDWVAGVAIVTFYKDNARIGQVSGVPTAAMSPVLYVKAGEAKAAVLTTDYIFVAVER